MSVKIESKNSAKIEEALKDVNKKSTQHTYTSYEEIAKIAEAAEKKVLSLLLKKDAAGAMYKETSGAKVALSYKQSRNATEVTMVRKTSGWYLTSIRSTSVGVSGGGRGVLTLTQAQADAAVKNLMKNFIVTQ